MVVAANGMPSFGLIVATLLGGALAAGSANAINCYWDRDIDSLMTRTKTRALPAHRVDERHALAFGLALGGAVGYGLALWKFCRRDLPAPL